MFDCWADPVVHLNLLKSLVDRAFESNPSFQIFHEETETTYNERIWVPVQCPAAGPDEDGLLIVNLVKKHFLKKIMS